MSEFWVSHKRYRCQYCDIWIADDAPSRQHHENGLRHKGNRERFIKGLYKQGEKAVKERAEEKREMAAIEKAAGAAYAVDVSAGRGSQSALAGPSSVPSKPKPATTPASTNKWANYSTAESLGYTDPDVERALQEAQMRQNAGIAGEWQVVTPTPAALAAAAAAGKEGSDDKRKWSHEEDEEGRASKMRKKILAEGLGELYDPGVIKIKVKEPPKEEEDVVAPPEKEEPTVKEENVNEGTMKPRWGKSWSTVDENAERERIKDEVSRQEERFLVPKAEIKEKSKEEEETQTVPVPEPEPPSTASLFKKRKGPPTGAKHGRPRP
ncbi:hypothetical protein DACRYDRAFT_20911 [Dacryopinax primogenitus]|uniref:Matrin-type domain-containing protein n=1 Tax=Dacryopinax primogenitus (strain DJM 731) TaxID=1858805 RepID=M5G880_DACPD|nr:uncharacterized protein DACRYDRAFT_20911 [Dacryopinax primogenitus]EJU04350.1 hypothetical protein DACRYDRAFT_20911 [Dacryopinax primogenitus]